MFGGGVKQTNLDGRGGNGRFCFCGCLQAEGQATALPSTPEGIVCVHPVVEQGVRRGIRASKAKPAATTFLATQRAAYAAERSTLLGSLPEKAPPP